MSDTYTDDIEEEDAADPLAEVFETAIQQFTRSQDALYEERQLCAEDRRFVDIAGAQYDSILFQNFDNKPKLEFNKTALSVMRIINEYRNNPITVDFVSRDGDANTKTADVCDGLFRADMQSSTGPMAILNGFEEGVKGGFGAFRLTTEYEDEYDEDNDYQRIRIEAIYDADTSVYFDLDAKNQDKSDAKHCFVLYSMTREAFAEEFDEILPETGAKPDATSMPKDEVLSTFQWYRPDVVYIAEYYCVEEVRKEVQIWLNVGGEEEKHWTEDFKEDPELLDNLLAVKSEFLRKKRVKVRKVHKYLMSGSQILEDCGYIAGKHIPIIPVYGMRSFVDNIERCRGQVRMAKDAQRLFNMQASKLAEIAALSSVSKPIFASEQMVGHAEEWAQDNIADYPYLLVESLRDDQNRPIPAGPIGYTKSPEIPQALAATITLTDTSMKEILGVSQEMQAVPANTSAEAIYSVFNRMDMQTYIFVSNLAVAVKWAGNVWLSMAREIYVDAGRKMKVVGTQDEVSSITLKKPNANEASGYENDLTAASFEVVASVGPSSTTKRQATVRGLTELLPNLINDPETAQMIVQLILYNTEGEGLDEAQEYIRKKLVQKGVMKPSDEEAKQMAEAAKNAPPDPQADLAKANTEFLLAEAEKAKVLSLKALSDIEKQRAETEKTQAQTLQILEAVQLDREQSKAEIQAMIEAFKSVMPQGQPAPAPVPATEAAPKQGFLGRMFGGGQQ